MERFNMSMRKYLKEVGVTSQQDEEWCGSKNWRARESSRSRWFLQARTPASTTRSRARSISVMPQRSRTTNRGSTVPEKESIEAEVEPSSK